MRQVLEVLIFTIAFHQEPTHQKAEVSKAIALKRQNMGEKDFINAIYQSMQDSAREIRLSLGRPSSHATRQQALQQVAMLKAAKEAQQIEK